MIELNVTKKFKNLIDKYNKWTLIQKAYVFISSFLFVLWLFAMMFQFIYKIMIGENYDLLLSYGQISLTVFGFTLIGGIFEKKKAHSDIEKKLFNASISFLITSISFFYLYSIIPLYLKDGFFIMYSNSERLVYISIGVTMFFAFVGIINGFISLLNYLIEHRVKIE